MFCCKTRRKQEEVKRETSDYHGDYLLIDQTGCEIYPPEDAVIEPKAWVENGLLPAHSKKNGLKGYINMNGQTVWCYMIKSIAQ